MRRTDWKVILMLALHASIRGWTVPMTLTP
jgi:hypothetical protein